MRNIKFVLFGTPQLERNGRPTTISRRKAMAMLAYLGVTGQTHSRDSLATLFWPEHPQSQARGNLRRALSDLNREVGEGLLLLDGENVALANDEVWIDVARFRDCLNSRSSHGHVVDETCPDCFPLLQESIGLYKADFLAGFTLRDTIKFDDWQYFEAESLRQQLASALEILVNGLSQRGEYETAIPHARRWLSIDPLHEPAQHILIRLYHQSGQSSAAIRQYELYVELLEKEIGELPTPETLALYEEIKANRMSVGEKIKSDHQTTSKLINNLPIQITPFVGREKELTEIAQRLREDPACRLITLVGPGGIGKTRLSVETAGRAMDTFHSGTAFVPLASVNDTAFIVSAIAEAIQFNFQGDADPRKQLLHHLSQKNYLLILDNFEQFLSASSMGKDRGGEKLVSEMLENAPQLKLVITSRERLHIQEEWVFDVQGMPFPQETAIPESEAQKLGDYTAIQLFIQRAQKAKSNFEISNEDLSAVIRICQLVGGMPLGIELAAPWVRLMSCKEIADEMERNFDLLETTLRNVPERHRSMRAIMEQTWEQLSEDEQSALSKLSIFRGGCTREAAEAVAGTTLQLLSALVDKALLRHVDTGRYELHELIRQFALEQLQKKPKNHSQSLKEHYHYYCAFLEQQIGGLKGGHQLETVNRITADIDNVRVSWRQAFIAKDQDAIEKSAESLFLYSEMSGRLVEAGFAFQQAAKTFEIILNQEPNTTVREKYESVLGYLLVLQGVMASHTGGLNGLEITKRGMELLQRHTHNENRRSQYQKAFCLMWLGWASFLPGFYNEAKQYLEEARAIFIEIGEHWGIAKSLFMISNPYIAQGQLVKAEQALRESLSICREIQDSRSRIMVNRTLGIVTLWFGDLPLTQQLLEEAVELSHEFNDLLGLENTLRELGKLQTAQGDLELAAQTLLQSIEICHEIGAHWEGELAYCDVAALYRVQGNYDAAEQAAQRGLDAAKSTKNRWWHPRALAELGCIAGYRKNYSLAEQLLLEALDLWKELNHEPFYAWGLAQLGHIKVEQGLDQSIQAGQLYKQGLELAIKHKQAPIALNIFVGMAKLLNSAGKQDKAIEMLNIVNQHPNNYYETKDKARKLLVDLNIEPSKSQIEQDWQILASEMAEMLDNSKGQQ
jgi:predicted ATPase/DNA-binding SARP family transcriptional activator